MKQIRARSLAVLLTVVMLLGVLSAMNPAVYAFDDYSIELTAGEMDTAVEGYLSEDFITGINLIKWGSAPMYMSSYYLKLEFTGGDSDCFTIEMKNYGTLNQTNANYRIADIHPTEGLTAGTYSATIALYYDIDGSDTTYGWTLKDSTTVSFTVISPEVKYAVTVINGTADKTQAAAEEYVRITADPPASGMAFSRWEVVSGSVAYMNSKVNPTKFKMLDSAVTIKAVYVPATYTADLFDLDTGTAVPGYNGLNYMRNLQVNKTGTAEMYGDTDHLKVELTGGDIDAFSYYQKTEWTQGENLIYTVGAIAPINNLAIGQYTVNVTLSYDFDGTGTAFGWTVLDVATVTFTVAYTTTPYTVFWDLNGGTCAGWPSSQTHFDGYMLQLDKSFYQFVRDNVTPPAGKTLYGFEVDGVTVTGTYSFELRKNILIKMLWKGLTGWQSIDGKLYYYKNGVKLTNWQKISGIWYYLDPSTGALKTGWVQSGNNYCYLDPGTYTWASGWKMISGVWFYFDPATLALKTGWVQSGSNYCYLDPYTFTWASGWKQVDGMWYYFDPSTNALKTGWLFSGSDIVYFDINTWSWAAGWKEIDGMWYYFNPSTNALQTGWVVSGGNYYYFDINTWSWASGWKQIDGVWCYFDPTTLALKLD